LPYPSNAAAIFFPQPCPLASTVIRILILLIVLLTALGSAGAQSAQQLVQVGVTAFRDKTATLKEWQPTMDFLTTSIPGTRFEVVPLNLPEFEGALREKQLDFLITNPQHYIAVEAIHSVSRIATLVKRENGQIVNQFGGVIVTKSDRTDIDSLAAVKGKLDASQIKVLQPVHRRFSVSGVVRAFF
jgi:ABC-type phosphate/phosphonate transport system substrate-binding protein